MVYWETQSTVEGCPWYGEYEVVALRDGTQRYTGRSRCVYKNPPSPANTYPQPRCTTPK